jgi:catalase
VDITLLTSLRDAVEEEGAILEIVAPQVGGVEASDGSWIEAKQKIDGGPSVLYDAVALLPSKDGVTGLAQESAVRDFIADAFAHQKFIGYVEAARSLLQKAGIPESLDEGFVVLEGMDGCVGFLTTCHQLRFWARAANVKKSIMANQPR